MGKGNVFLLCLCCGLFLYLGAWANAAIITNGAAKENEDYRYYILNDTYISLVRYIGSEKVVTIPEEIENKKVIKVGKNCFANNKKITKVMIPDGVTYIDDGAFAGSVKLLEVSIPDSVQYIGYGVFNASGIRSFRMPKGILVQDHVLVEACPDLKEIVLTDIKSLDTEDVNVMNRGCPKLKEFKVEGEDSPFFVINGVLFLRRVQKVIGSADDEDVYLVAYPQGKKDKKYYIPDGVTKIMEQAFSDCQYLEELIVSNDVKRMRFELSSKKPLRAIFLNSQIDILEARYPDCLLYYADSKLSIQAAENSTDAHDFADKYRIPFIKLDETNNLDGGKSSVEGLGSTSRVEDLEEYYKKVLQESESSNPVSDPQGVGETGSPNLEGEGNRGNDTDTNRGYVTSHIEGTESEGDDTGSVAASVDLDGNAVNDRNDGKTNGGKRSKGLRTLIIALSSILIVLASVCTIVIFLPRKLKQKKETEKLRYSREWPET